MKICQIVVDIVTTLQKQYILAEFIQIALKSFKSSQCTP